MISFSGKAKQAHWAGKLARSLLFVFLLAACTASENPARPIELPTVAVPSIQAESTGAGPTPTVIESTEPPASATEPILYTVQGGDTVSSIAAQFGLQPETVLWANYEQLFDNPDMLLSGVELLILPVDGVYHQVGGGDDVNNLAAFFGVDPEAIIEWTGNDIDPQSPDVFVGEWVLVPGGRRASRRRQMPNVTREAAAISAGEFGSGACRDNFGGGPVGDGEYAWPVKNREVRGEGYWSGHMGVDLAVEVGEWVRAADDGVVVFSGWSNLGYGYLVMLDHGYGDFSLFSGLQKALAVCGQGVAEGEVIAEGGITGHPAGALLHFEVRRGAEFLDPLAVLPNSD